MKKLVFTALLLTIGLGLINHGVSKAEILTSTSAIEHVLITRIQVGGTGTGTSNQEYIQLYNPTSEIVDITDWCLVYNTSTEVVCFTDASNAYTYTLNTRSYLLATSNAFLTANPVVVQDFVFTTTSNIASTNGSVTLHNKTGDVIDRVGWGTGLNEGFSLPGNIIGGTTLERKKDASTDEWIDTDLNASDFTTIIMPASLESGGVVETEIPRDTCRNIEGVQSELPDGYLLDENNDCQKDLCTNIDDLQVKIPNGYESKTEGICLPIPLEDSPLFITEVFPNPTSYDTGLEFIEFYNPNSASVSLKGYLLEITSSSSGTTKSYVLPDRNIAALSYIILSDSAVGYTLTNTGASLKLTTPAGTEVSNVTGYSTAPDDQSWSLIDDVWQYSNQPTPESSNLLSHSDIPDDDQDTTNNTTLPPCGEGKYRNLETNRCKSIETVSVLAACPTGQTRNPETNRCRSNTTATTLLTPCKAGQYRNPETNRCKSIETASALVPCKEGQERNPETNRCRNISNITTDSSVIDSLAPVVSQATNPVSSYRIVAGAALVISIVGYALYEWRSDIGRLFKRR